MKIVIIGSPGSGKSVLTKKLNQILNYPVLHLDRIYHTGGKSHLSRTELINKVKTFAFANERWIIDGNYISTIEDRVQMADTVLLLDLPTKTCVENIHKREHESLYHGINHDDMAEDFDHTLTDEFIHYVESFKDETLPKIQSILSRYSDSHIYVFTSYAEISDFLCTFEMNLCHEKIF